MAKLILREEWKELQRRLIANGKFIQHDCIRKDAAQFLVLELSQFNIPFKVINLGAGVTRITTEVDTCPKCKGTGKC